MLPTLRFLNKHKFLITASAVAVGSFIGLKKYSSNFHEQWQNSESRGFVSQVRQRAIYFEEALSIGNRMINEQYKLIVKKIRQLFNVEEILHDLENARINNLPKVEQLAYFERIKLEIFTLIVSEVYVISFFVTYLRIQLSMISGMMYYERNSSNDRTRTENSNVGLTIKDSNSHYCMFVGLLNNFHQYGVEHLVSSIRKIVESSLVQLKVTEKIATNGLFSYFNEIEKRVSENLERLIEENASIVFTFNNTRSESPDQQNLVNELQRCLQLIDEILDIVKLPDFHDVIKKCSSIGFSNLSDFIYECFVHYEDQNSNNNRKNELIGQERRQFINPHLIQVPLCKMLPCIWKKIMNDESLLNNYKPSEFSDQQKSRNTLLIEYLLCSDSLACLTANIYEGFCNENTN